MPSNVHITPSNTFQENSVSINQKESTGFSSSSGIVARIPVESIKKRVAAELLSPLGIPEQNNAISGNAIRKILASATVKEALETMRQECPSIKNPLDLYDAFLRGMRSEFSSSSKRESWDIWESLRSYPEFETAIILYLKRIVPEIFKNKYSRSLYEDIEYALFLLGSPKDFDVLQDIRLGSMQGISRIFARRHSSITRELSAINTLQSGETVSAELVQERLTSFDRKVSAFEQLCEIINKIAAMHSISALDKDRALSLIRMIAAQISAVGNELETITHDSFAQDKLRFIEGKLLGNYSHLEFFDGKTSAEILRNAERICANIGRGFDLQWETNFGGVPERKKIAASVKLGNLAHVWLTAIAKIRKIERLDSELEALERKWLDVLLNLYSKAAGGGRNFQNIDDVTVDFSNREDHEEFMIETMHHLLLFGNVSEEPLFRVASKLIGDDHYHNAYHEEFKIKLFSVILEKFRELKRSDRTIKIAYWIREYARKHEKSSGLVMSFSQLYISLAVYFASLPGTESRKNAMECYLRASRVTDESWKLKFEGHEAEFLKFIGGKSKLKEFEELLCLQLERDIHARLLGLIGETLRWKGNDNAYRSVCDIVEEFFFGICSAEIKGCGCEAAEFGISVDCGKRTCVPKNSKKGTLRGNRSVPVPLGYSHYLLLQYPANLEEVFERIFDKHRDFIYNNISNLLNIITSNRQLSETNQHLREANEKIDQQLRSDSLTGLPNLRQYEDDVLLLAEIPKVASILIKVENLTEVNSVYGVETGNKFLKGIVSGPIGQFFATSQDQWKVYRTSPKEFLIVGDYQGTKNGIPFSDIIPYFYELFSTFTFFPESNGISGDWKNGLCLRAQITLSYSDQIKTDIYKKLRIAIQEAQNGPRTISYNEERHSERNILENLKGWALVTEALQEDRFIPYYQAIVNNSTGEIEKYECLARIKSKDGTILPPSAFVDHAKRWGTIPLVTRQMFEKICRDLTSTTTNFSINISWQDLADPGFIPDLKEKMKRYDIDSKRITFEILEEALLSGKGEYTGKISELKWMGCKIALDDFGSESSNFSRFETSWWPDVIKIDGSFIKNLDKSREKQRIVRAIVKAGKELGCEIVAEHVDSIAIWEIVTEMGIQSSQWYLFHKPQGLVEGSVPPTRIDLVEVRLRTQNVVSGILA